MAEIAELVGARVQGARQRRDMTQQQLGTALADYLDKPWSRQSVSIAEKGGRGFTIAELIALAAVLKVSVIDLVLPEQDVTEITLPEVTLDRETFASLVSPKHWRREGELTIEVDRLRAAVQSVAEMRDIFDAAVRSTDPDTRIAGQVAAERTARALDEQGGQQ